MSGDELAGIKERMTSFLVRAAQNHELDMIIFMLTNIIDESTEMLCYGERAPQLVEEAFPSVKVVDNAAVIPHVVSRKKQVVPALLSVLNRTGEE